MRMLQDCSDYKSYEAGPWVIHAKNDIQNESPGGPHPILLGFKFIGSPEKLRFVGNRCDIYIGLDQGTGQLTINGVCIDHDCEKQEVWVSRK